MEDIYYIKFMKIHFQAVDFINWFDCSFLFKNKNTINIKKFWISGASFDNFPLFYTN